MPNDLRPIGNKTLKQRRARRTRLGRLRERLVATAHIYHIPCIKHMLCLGTALARLALNAAFAFADPHRPSLDPLDLWPLLFFLSAALHEARQVRRHGVLELADELQEPDDAEHECQ